MLGEILVTEGPQKGERFELHDPCILQVSDGRLLLGPAPEQPQPCGVRFERRDEGPWVEPGGKAPVLFNQRALDEGRAVEHGDMLALGGVSFVFYISSGRTRRRPAGQHRVLSRRALRDVSSVVDELHAHRSHLAAFYRIVSEIHLGVGLEELMGRMLEALLEELPAAERAFIFGVGPDGEMVQQATAFRDPSNCSTRVSRSMLEEVLREKDAILSRNVLADERFRERESLMIDRINTAICAPFLKNQAVTGAVLVDSTRPGQPFGAPDLELVTAVAGQLSLALERHRLQEMEQVKESLEEEKRTLDRALVEAQAVQQFLLPSALPEVLGCKLAVRSHFCEQLGGDYYDLFGLDGHRMALVVADVSGHSISSALVMAMTRSVVRCYCEQYADPAAVLAATNRAVRADTRTGMLVTLFLGFLNTREMTLTFANAGHHHPLLYEAGRGRLRDLDSGGFPIGLRAGAEYPLEKIYLKGGDCLVFYTDGVVEAKDPAGRMFGKQGLLRRLGQAEWRDAAAVADLVHEAVEIHRAGHPPADDLSILTLSVDPAYDSLFFEVSSSEQKAEEAARIIAAYARDHGFLPERREAHFRLVLREASANAMTHGNRDHPGKKIGYYVRSDERTLRLSVTDEGQGFRGNERLKQIEIDTRTQRGRGLFLIRKYADAVSYNDRGNELVLDFRRDGFSSPDSDGAA